MTTFTLNLFNNNFENKKEHVGIKSRIPCIASLGHSTILTLLL